MLTGYRPYASLLAALRHVECRVQPIQHDSPHDYVTYWGDPLDRELQELNLPQ